MAGGLKILLVLEATLGGTGRHILDLADGLLRAGFRVHLVYSPVRSDIQFRRGLEALHQRCPEFRSHSIRIARSVTPSDPIAYLKLLFYLRRNGPFDAVHAHSTKAGFLTRLLAGRGRAISLYTPHGLMTTDPELRGLRRFAVSALEAFLSRLCTAVIVVSQEELRCALQTGIRAEKLLLIPNGVDTAALATRFTEREAVRRSLGVPSGALCIGYVGRLCDHKRPERMLQAFAIVRARIQKTLRLVMVGSGPLETPLRRLASDLGISEDVIWGGPVDGAETMPAFDVLGHTSRSEGLSYVFLEAMASGVPIVTTRVGGAEELLLQEGAGCVCDPWDATDFADGLYRLLDDRPLREAFSAAARRAVAAYDVTTMVASIAALYRRSSVGPEISRAASLASTDAR